MENKAYRIEYRKTEAEQGYEPRRNLETSEPIWETDKDWKEFFMIRFE